jgi:hypothetical protein
VILSEDRERAERKLRRYLGAGVSAWDDRFDLDSMTDAKFLRLVPTTLTVRDLSFEPANHRG